jgi:hypothetical protein
MAMGTDPMSGKTIRWTYTDGGMKGMSYEHQFSTDGMVTWKEAGSDATPSADSSAAYEFAQIKDALYAVSYLSGSGYTLTTVVDEKTGKIVSFASNEKALTVHHGEIDGAKRRVA